MKFKLEVLDENEVWQEKTIEIDPDADFTISDVNLDKEMLQLSSKLQFYGDLASELRAQASRKKQHQEEAYATECLKIRQSATTKITNDAVKEQAICSIYYTRACNETIEAEKSAKKVEGFYKSLTKVADLLIALCYKQNNELKRMGSF